LRPASTTALRWFLVLELLSVSGFLAFLGLGNMGLALLFLFGPFQALAWLAAFKGSSYVLILFVALLPAAGLELLPVPYHRYVYFPMTVLTLFVVTRSFLADGGGIGREPLDRLDTIPLALLVVSLVLSTANALVHGWTQVAFWQQVALLAEAIVFVYFFSVVPTTTGEVRTIVLTFCVFLSAAIVAVRLVSVLAGGLGAQLGGITNKGGLNVFGTFLSCGAALLLGVFLQTDKASTRTIMLLCVAVVLSTLVLTRSRGAWFGFGAAVVYALLRARSGWLWTVVVLAVLLLLGVGSLREILVSRAGETSEGDPSFLGRVALWAYAWKVIKSNWLLGVGFNNFRYVKHFYGYPEPLWTTIRFHAHNIFLEMLVDLGVIGFVGFCWLYVRTMFHLDRVVRARTPDRWALALGLGAALIAFAAHGLIDFVAWQYGALALLSMLLGLGINLCRLDRERRDSFRSPRTGPPHTIGAGPV
jgi:O-antigen ligase